jgi:hypothetical protein
VGGRSAARAASGQRDGLPVVDPWGGRWLVRWYRAPVLGPPEPTASLDTLHALLDPRWWGRTSPVTEPPPAASWVMGGRARWQGSDAPGTEDPVLDHAGELSWAIGSLSDGVPSLWQLVGAGQRAADAARALRAERARPWAVSWSPTTMRGPSGGTHPVRTPLSPPRTPSWPPCTQGMLPVPPGAVLRAVSDPRGAAGR